VFFHGGGWVIGSVATYDPDCARLAARTGAIVLSVEYRLAPEHRFPAAVDDAVAAMRWAHANAARLGIDPARIAVAGDSAGGNLAAVVAQELRGRPEAPALQLLIYPATDAHADIPEKRQPIPGMLQPADLEWFEGHYLRSAEDRRDPRFSPNLTADLTGLPPAIVALAEFDPLYPEGLAYTQRLQAAGVPVELLSFSGLIHGFLAFAALLPSCRTAEEELHTRLRTALGGA
jgi:acetyl esterase